MIINGSAEFLKKAKQAVYDVCIEGLCATDEVGISLDDIYVVTFGYILGNMKAMISTTLPDGKYYEVTYDKSTCRMYVDCYVKFKQSILE